MKRYGCMLDIEENFIDRILDQTAKDFGGIRFLEIGVFGGETVRGIANWGKEQGIPVDAAGVDWPDYKPNPAPDCPYTFYDGDSMDAWRRITFAFNFLFIDGCHCVNHAMCDFLNYSQFLDVGGYCLFHDTSAPAGKQTQDAFPQNHSYAGQPPSVLGVREALMKLGLIQEYRSDWTMVEELTIDTGIGGMCLFKKLT